MVNPWDLEEALCIECRARTVPIPALGESERVRVGDVFDRSVWFPSGGIYVLRDGEAVMYVGHTTRPLRVRLQGSLYRKRAWTMTPAAVYRDWTVALVAAPDYPRQTVQLQALIVQLKPRFLTLGRPPKPVAVCACRGACPECGLPRAHEVRCDV